MTKWPVRERGRKLQRDAQFLQAGLCGLVAPSPPPPLHISFAKPPLTSGVIFQNLPPNSLLCNCSDVVLNSCNLYYDVGGVVISGLFWVCYYTRTRSDILKDYHHGSRGWDVLETTCQKKKKKMINYRYDVFKLLVLPKNLEIVHLQS